MSLGGSGGGGAYAGDTHETATIHFKQTKAGFKWIVSVTIMIFFFFQVVQLRSKSWQCKEEKKKKKKIKIVQTKVIDHQIAT